MGTRAASLVTMALRPPTHVALVAWLAVAAAPACVFDLADVTSHPGDAGAQRGDAGSGSAPYGSGSPTSTPTATGTATATTTTTATPTTSSTGGGTGAPASTAKQPLCGPCAGSTDCAAPGAICLAYADASTGFCGQSCAAAACPTGYDCVPVTVGTSTTSQCTPASGACP